MIFCDSCRRKRNWSISIARFTSNCQVCGKTTVCYDVPDVYLSRPARVVNRKYRAKHRKDK
jgi:hypothetical protein